MNLKYSLKLISIFTLSGYLGACSTKKQISENTNNTPNLIKNEQKLNVDFNSELEEKNEIKIESEFTKSHEIYFYFSPDKSGNLEFSSPMAIGINCNIDDVKNHLHWNEVDSELNDIEIELPHTLRIQKDKKYILKYNIEPSTCEYYSLTFTTKFKIQKDDLIFPSPFPTQTPILYPNPSPSPTPNPISKIDVSPKPEPGFIAEEQLDTYGGDIELRIPTKGYYYKDFKFTYSKGLKIYRNVFSGSSNCETNKKLELLELGENGVIVKKIDITDSTSQPLKGNTFYRLRFSIILDTDCSFVYESFNIGKQQ